MAAPARSSQSAAPGKSAEAFRTISEVSQELDLPQHVLRFWETRFAQLKPMKRNGGRRLYRPDHIALLRGIKALLYDDGMTIKGAQKVLREQGSKAVIARGRADAELTFRSPKERLPEDITDRLHALRSRLGLSEDEPETAPTAEAAAEPAEAAAEGNAEPAEPTERAEPAETPAPRPSGSEPSERESDAERIRASIARLEALLARLESH